MTIGLPPREHFMRNLWRWSAGVPEEPWPPEVKPEKQWSPRFEQLMRNRLLLGAYRYGAIHSEFKPAFDRVGAIKKRVEAYAATGNKELLVDVANLALLEFEECRHPLEHFCSVDDGEHVGIVKP